MQCIWKNNKYPPSSSLISKKTQFALHQYILYVELIESIWFKNEIFLIIACKCINIPLEQVDDTIYSVLEYLVQ